MTQRHLAEAALATARAELANAAKISSLGVLTASIAHEVSQPLSGIITNASASVPNTAGSARMAELTPIVFVVDDDISVRNSLEWLIRFEGWKAETFSSAQDFWRVHGSPYRTVWSSMYLFRGSAA